MKAKNKNDKLKDKLRVWLHGKIIAAVSEDAAWTLQSQVIEVNHYRELLKLFRWNHEPLLDRGDLSDFENEVDLNERRVRDAEAVATVARNCGATTCVEIGTADGHGTVLIAVNAPGAKVYTVNILPEEIASGAGGQLVTGAPTKEQIGRFYRQRGLTNIEQIYANTAVWQPKFNTVEFALIDGCHDEEFVYSDTKKLLPFMRPGSFLLWHDFSPRLMKVYPWIGEVCRGVCRLQQEGLIKGRIYHLRDSWVGIHRISA